jgi:non-homologous end joining protein Ku
MHQLVEDKAEKKEIVSAQPEGINNVISLEEALQRSVEKQRQARQQQEESKPTTRKSTRKKA